MTRLAVSDNELAGALEELVRAGRIAIYCVDGTWVCQLLDFDRHQPIARLKRAPSRWPAPPTDRQTPPVEKAWEHDSDTARHGNGAPKTPAKSLIGKDRREKTEETRLTGSPTVVPQYAELPISQPEEHAEAAPDERLRFGKWNLADVARTLRGADAGTAYALASVLRGLPEGAMARALEGLDSRRRRQPPIQHEAKWLVSTIVQMRQEGQFS